MTDFFDEIDGVKKAARDNIRADISAAINKAHYTQGVSREVAAALACEVVVECYSRVGGRDGAAALRWMADQLDNLSMEDGDDNWLLYE
jgi:hypothetical protein